MFNYFYNITIIVILLNFTIPFSCKASVNPPISNKIQKKKAIQSKHSKTHLSFKKPYYYGKKPLDYRQPPPKAPETTNCEGPDLGQVIGALLAILLLWAIPTGVLVLLGVVFGLTWLWILGLVLFLIPVVFVLLLVITVAFY